MHICSYISGYVDGEGCFCVSFQPSKRHLLGWEVRPSFSVSQNADRAELLFYLKDNWKCGTIRPDRSDKTLKFEVRAISDLISKVIPHFKEYPMMSSKQKDFLLFESICRIVSDSGHRTPTGLETIIKLAEQMNTSGKRKYSGIEILNSIAVR